MFIPTVRTFARDARRLDRRNRGMITVLAQMRRGAVLSMHFARSKSVWVLSSGGKVPFKVATMVIAHPDVCGVGDSLFDNGPHQTWRYIGRKGE
jgi:hypothetical protein